MKKYISAALIMASIAFLPAGAPSAQAGWEGCDSGKNCVYWDTNGNNIAGWRWAGSALENVSDNFNDQMSSWWNNSNKNGAWYYHANGVNPCFNMFAGKSGSYQWSFDNDQMSSWKTNGACNGM